MAGGSLIADPWAALGTSAPARGQCCRGGVRTLVAGGRSSQERRVGDRGGQPLVPVPAASSLSMRLRRSSGRYASTHGHTRGIVFSPAHSGFHRHGPAPACAHLGSLCVEPGVQDMLSGSRSHRRRPGCSAGGMGEPHWLCGLQIFITGLGSLPLLAGRESGS